MRVLICLKFLTEATFSAERPVRMDDTCVYLYVVREGEATTDVNVKICAKISIGAV